MEEGGKVYMGGDSAAVQQDTLDRFLIVEPKIFKVNNLLFGCTTSFRMIQLLKYELLLPEQEPDMDDMSYLVSVVGKEIRLLFQEEGFSTVKDNEARGGEFLIGYHGKLYTMNCDFSIQQYSHGFHAVGCGAPFALGAMDTLQNWVDDTPTQKLYSALVTAEKFSAGVRPPFHFLEE
jgi:hypothetical protein